jgi:hypothetical protein
VGSVRVFLDIQVSIEAYRLGGARAAAMAVLFLVVELGFAALIAWLLLGPFPA